MFVVLPTIKSQSPPKNGHIFFDSVLSFSTRKRAHGRAAVHAVAIGRQLHMPEVWLVDVEYSRKVSRLFFRDHMHEFLTVHAALMLASVFCLTSPMHAVRIPPSSTCAAFPNFACGTQVWLCAPQMCSIRRRAGRASSSTTRRS
eukprot:6195817-Pleurochrysis_carterae.AAC.1